MSESEKFGMRSAPMLKAETSSGDLMGLSGAARELLKARVSSYTRKDGTFVKEHDDGRAAAKPAVPTAPRPKASQSGNGYAKEGGELSREDMMRRATQMVTTGKDGNFPNSAEGYSDAMKRTQSEMAGLEADGFKAVKKMGGSGGKSEERRFGPMSGDDHHIIDYKHDDGRQARLSWTSSDKGHRVVREDAAKPDTPAQKVKSALYDDDKASLGRHSVGDKVVSGRYGKSGVVKGARDGRVVVEHPGGYTESYHHQDLSPAGSKGTGALKEKLASRPSAKSAEASGDDKADVPDAENPKLSLNSLGSEHVAAAASGKHDLNKQAKVELASRGLDAGGNWVGFKKAPAAHGLSDSDMESGKASDDNPVAGHFQTLHPSVLSAAASGKFDMNAHAKKEAASRGIDQSGKWVGFDKAREIHGVGKDGASRSAGGATSKWQVRDRSGNVVKNFHGADAEHQARQHVHKNQGKGLSWRDVSPKDGGKE